MSWTKRNDNRLLRVCLYLRAVALTLKPTLGIWMCRGKNMQVMVMDVEGTDGRERGEDQVLAMLLSNPKCVLTVF